MTSTCPTSTYTTTRTSVYGTTTVTPVRLPQIPILLIAPVYSLSIGYYYEDGDRRKYCFDKLDYVGTC